MDSFAVTGHKWIDLLLIGAAVLTALGVVWRKLLKPLVQGVKAFVRGVATFERVAPTLVAIGEQFTPNGGSSLRDSIDRIERIQQEDHDYTHKWRHELSNEITKLVLADKVVASRLDAIAVSDTVKIRKLDEIAAGLPPVEPAP